MLPSHLKVHHVPTMLIHLCPCRRDVRYNVKGIHYPDVSAAECHARHPAARLTATTSCHDPRQQAPTRDSSRAAVAGASAAASWCWLVWVCFEKAGVKVAHKLVVADPGLPKGVQCPEALLQRLQLRTEEGVEA
jgi:hypothetical protein